MIIAFSGTGTGVGKTTTAVALVDALRRSAKQPRAWKPIETGGDDDGRRLTLASGDDAMAAIRLAQPIAPSVAARLEGVEIDVPSLVRMAGERDRGILVVETAGGLFSPLGPGVTNAELVAALQPAVHVLVAPNRLGVLHDVEACRRACAAMALRIDVVVLTGRATDPSVSTNRREIETRVAAVEHPSEGDAEPLLGWLLRAGCFP